MINIAYDHDGSNMKFDIHIFERKYQDEECA